MENEVYLLSCCSQVLQILTLMKLEAHLEMFEKEAITGEVLAGCDEDMLKTELNITSRLHRMKLLALIRGNPQTWHQLENSKSTGN